MGEKMKIGIVVIVLTLLSVLGASAKNSKIQKAPLPGEVLAAKKVFLLKGEGTSAGTVDGGFDLAFDAFYSAMKVWGRYTITEKPEDADLIMQISYAVSGSRSGSIPNTSNHTTTVYTIIDTNLTLEIYNQTKTELWSTSVEPGRAFLKQNQEKEMSKAGEKLVTILKGRM
jgi:hypothetical protein